MTDFTARAGRRLPELILVAVTFVWGGTFLVTQAALADGGPFGLLFLRFAIGAGTLYVLFRPRMTGVTRAELGAATTIGVVTFASYATQAIGLQFITSSKSAFITAMYVPAVPLLQLLVLGMAPRRSAWAGIAVSFTGLLILSSPTGLEITLGRGEWLTIAAAITAAMQIIFISRWAPSIDPMKLACLQFAVVAVLALVAMPLAAERMPNFSGLFILAAGGLGVLGTAFALGAMNWAQRTVSATRATIIYALEPVWAGIFGVMAGETLTTRTLVGSALIVAGVVVSELRIDRSSAG